METRRRFLRAAAAGGLLGKAGLGIGLTPVTAAEATVDSKNVRFDSSIEPLVAMLENTPRNRVIEEVSRRVRNGLSYRQLLAALQLAGVRNVQPRPSVGFKFHAVLVVNSAHLASLASPDEDRWLPIFWAIDNFKSSQARDVREGNWTMPRVDEASVPTGAQAHVEFQQAMGALSSNAATISAKILAAVCGSQARPSATFQGKRGSRFMCAFTNGSSANSVR